MKRAARQIAVCAGMLIAFCVVCRLVFFRTYTAYVPLSFPQQGDQRRDVQLDIEKPEVLDHGEVGVLSGYLRVPIEPRHAGDTFVDVRDRNGEIVQTHHFRVGPLLTVYDTVSGGFNGDTAVLVAVTLFWLLVTAIMVWHFSKARGPAFYGYGTIYFSGFSLFSLVTGGLMLRVTVSHMVNPMKFNMSMAYSEINSASRSFMMLTTPAIVLFAAAMAVSNVALLRHERPRPQNALGILVAVLLIAGEALGWYLFSKDFSGPEWEGRISSTLENVYATVFVYFECMLAGSVICGIKAAQHQPAPDQDFIIILGCWFRRDGTLPPLLRGRVERAIAFWQVQKEQTGKEAHFIPSGGRGRDEPMPEGEAMRRYLLSRKIPDALIHPECRARNTFENMAYSKKIMAGIHPGGKAVFATTNYHVFRSGVWAAQAGLPAEGIGGKTKWWFWPNAFMRECAGLLARRWKEETALLIALVVFFGVLSMMLR